MSSTELLNHTQRHRLCVERAEPACLQLQVREEVARLQHSRVTEALGLQLCNAALARAEGTNPSVGPVQPLQHCKVRLCLGHTLSSKQPGTKLLSRDKTSLRGRARAGTRGTASQSSTAAMAPCWCHHTSSHSSSAPSHLTPLPVS